MAQNAQYTKEDLWWEGGRAMMMRCWKDQLFYKFDFLIKIVQSQLLVASSPPFLECAEVREGSSIYF